MQLADDLMSLSRFETVAAALRSLGGQGRPAEIAEEIRRLFPGPHPVSLLQSVRGRIQECSSDSKIWRGKRDLFFSVHGIGGGVWGLRELDPLNPANQEGFVDWAEPFMASEGTASLRTHLRRERSRMLIERFKAELQSFSCAVCEFNFLEEYGEIGRGFIEAHHKVPVAQMAPGARTRVEDLAPVCSNCHRMLHRSAGISIEYLKKIMDR